jgi:hypothetical protein
MNKKRIDGLRETLTEILKKSPYPLAPHEIDFRLVGHSEQIVGRELRRMTSCDPPICASVWRVKSNLKKQYKCWYVIGTMTHDQANVRANTLRLF